MPGYPFSVVLLEQQDRSSFTCGNQALDTYLRSQAGQDLKRKVAACFVAIDNSSGEIAGYFTLSACHAKLSDIADDWQKKLPRYPEVPCVRLGRLAVDLKYQGNKLGVAMLADATFRAMRSDIAAHMMIVDAKDGIASAFYTRHGFREDPVDPLRLYAPLANLSRRLGLA